MNAAEEMERIESHAFAAAVNLASDFRTFLRALTSQPEVQALSGAMAADGVTLAVLQRVFELAGVPADEPYEHPADSALAAYLWLLSARDPDGAERAAATVLGCERCWWARKMAEHVQQLPRSHSVTGQGSLGE